MLTPNVLWAQSKDAVFLTVDLTDPENLDVKFTENSLSLKANKGGNEYSVSLEFLHPIKPDEVKTAKERILRYRIPKVTSESWSTLCSGPKRTFVRCDWDRWVDSDAEDNDLDASFDMSGFGGDFGDMGEFEDDDDYADEGDDDDDEEVDDVAASESSKKEKADTNHDHKGDSCCSVSSKSAPKVESSKEACSNADCACDPCDCGPSCPCPEDKNGACKADACCSPTKC